jgi:hypothetical protein
MNVTQPNQILVFKTINTEVIGWADGDKRRKLILIEERILERHRCEYVAGVAELLSYNTEGGA